MRQAPRTALTMKLRRNASRPGLALRAPGGLLLGLILLCATVLPSGRGALASDLHANPQATQIDPEMDALLRQVEQQVSAGHAVSPLSNSAMETWKQVVGLEKTDPDSQGFRSAIGNFVMRMRAQAAEQKTAGKTVIASDLTVFADQANRLLGLSGPASASQPDHSQIVASQPAPEATSAAKVPETPMATDRQPEAPIAKPDGVRTEATTPPSLSGDAAPKPKTAEAYAVRGDEMMAAHDIPAAREAYGYAAMAGNARAAVALARTYDPDFSPIAKAKTDPGLVTALAASEVGNQETDFRPKPPVAQTGSRGHRLRVAAQRPAARPPVPWYTQVFNRLRTLVR
jgi:hypothetical protein